MRHCLLLTVFLMPSAAFCGQEKASDAARKLQAARTESKTRLQEYVGLPTDVNGPRVIPPGDPTETLRAQIKRELELDLIVQMQRVDAAQQRLTDAKSRIERSMAAIEALVDQELKIRVAGAKQEKLELEKAESSPGKPAPLHFETPDALLAHFNEAAARGETSFELLAEWMTDDCVNEMAGLMLQQLGFLSALNQIAAQTGGVVGESGGSPIVAPVGPGFLAIDALEKHILDDPPVASEQAFKMMMENTLALAFSEDEPINAVIPNDHRITLRMAAGILKSPRKFIQEATTVMESMSDETGKAAEPDLKQHQWKVTADGDKATAIDIAATESPATHLTLRRKSDGWVIDSVFSDEMIQLLAFSFKGLNVSDD